ncbi:MAG TPA: autoinducer binding domain-containing protein [Burkholderiaceae bacterium]|nr:autoinducer binding domain-containing protein [Burkholderiaceae bacterium]
MLHNHHLGVLAAQSEGEFRAEIARFAQNLGFRTVDALTVIDHESSSSEFICVSNIESTGWNDIDPSCGRRDPVMQHCKRSSIPIVWGSKNYRAPELADLYEMSSAFGLRSGISVSAHLRNGRHFMLGVHTDQDLQADTRHIEHALPQLQFFATHALDAAFRLFLPAEASPAVQLTRLEVDALSWVLDGKSNEEIALMLNLSETSLTICLKKIAHSLECANEHQAALKAVRLGIIY